MSLKLLAPPVSPLIVCMCVHVAHPLKKIASDLKDVSTPLFEPHPKPTSDFVALCWWDLWTPSVHRLMIASRLCVYSWHSMFKVTCLSGKAVWPWLRFYNPSIFQVTSHTLNRQWVDTSQDIPVWSLWLHVYGFCVIGDDLTTSWCK